MYEVIQLRSMKIYDMEGSGLEIETIDTSKYIIEILLTSSDS